MAGSVTNKDISKGFPIDTPIFSTLDHSIHRSWKNLEGGFYDMWNSLRSDRKTNGAFLKDAYAS